MIGNSLKILHIIPSIRKGGAEKVVCDLSNCLSKNNQSIDLLTLYPNEEDSFLKNFNCFNCITVIQNNNNRIFAYISSFIWMYKNLTKLKRYDVIHCHLTFSSIFCTVLYFLFKIQRHRRTQIFETYHAVGMPISKAKTTLHLFLSRFRDGLILMAEDEKWSHLKSFYPCKKIYFVPNGINLSALPKIDKEKYYDRVNELRFASCVVGSVSQFRPERIPEKITQLFVEISRESPCSTQFLFVGDGELHLRCKSAIKSYGLEHRIHLPGGTINAHIPMSLIDIFVTLNIGKISGVAALEAVRAGCCVVGIQLNSNFVANEEDFIWSTSNMGALKEKIMFLLQNKEKREEISRRQRSILHKRYDLEDMVERYIQIYKNSFAGD